MTLTPAQQNQINLIGTKMNALNAKMNRSVGFATPRVKGLLQSDFVIEALLINSQVLEHYLKLTIQAFASRREILELVGEEDIYKKVDLEFKKEKPLGALIGVVKQLRITPELGAKLDHFNSLRKEATHHILDGDRDIPAFEVRVRNYLKSQEFVDLYREIYEVQEGVRLEAAEIIVKYGSP